MSIAIRMDSMRILARIVAPPDLITMCKLQRKTPWGSSGKAQSKAQLTARGKAYLGRIFAQLKLLILKVIL